MAQLLVFLLGGVSAAIQGIRLNYVESFTKFYKGNGTMFQPFGARVSKEV
jgi:V/A-type H+-transporting ATPase subunit I